MEQKATAPTQLTETKNKLSLDTYSAVQKCQEH